MALREVRTDLNKPLRLVGSFIGIAYFSKFVKGECTRVVVDGRSVPFTFEYTPPRSHTERVVEDGIYWDRVRGRATVKGIYDETIELEWVYSTFKDKAYRQMRPNRAEVTMRCTNWDTLKYPPAELFAMITATFKDI